VCRICKREAEVIHHISYDAATLRGEDFSKLAPLCHGCHQRVEFRNEDKRSLKEAEVVYGRLLKGLVLKEKTGQKLKRKVKKRGNRFPRKKCLTCGSTLGRKRPCKVCTKREQASQNRLKAKVTVTKDVLCRGVTVNGGWTMRQLRILGVEWPPVKGWVKTVLGKELKPEELKEFVSIGKATWDELSESEPRGEQVRIVRLTDKFYVTLSSRRSPM